MNKAIFLDRDGVIIAHDPESKFVYKKEQIVILPGVYEALIELKTKDYLLLTISNQSVIAEGISTCREVEELNRFINSKLDNLIDKFYFCPHHPTGHGEVPEQAKKYITDCNCRKPAPGMILKAAKELDINLKESWLVGDMVSDIAAGKAVGCKTVLVNSPHTKKIITTAKPFNVNIKADHNAKSLLGAINLI